VAHRSKEAHLGASGRVARQLCFPQYLPCFDVPRYIGDRAKENILALQDCRRVSDLEMNAALAIGVMRKGELIDLSGSRDLTFVVGTLFKFVAQCFWKTGC
jgi:hypothetical protein